MRIHRFVALACVSAVSALTGVASAGAGQGTVNQITVESGANVAVITVTGMARQPVCTGMQPGTLGIDLTTPRGTAQLALAQAALLSGKQVYVIGTNACVAYNNGTASSTEGLAIISLIR